MNFSGLDLTVIFTYLIGVFSLAIVSGRLAQRGKEVTADEQYLAGRDLTFLESMCSIVATEVSALTFLGIPAIAFKSDYSFLQIYLGALGGRLVIGHVLLPKLYNKGLTVYGVMGHHGSTESGQRMVSLFYVIAKLLSIGVRLFSGSILVAEFFQLNIYVAVAITTFVTFLYTLIGGLKAVVRTDMAQMGVFVLGGISAHFIIPDVANSGWSELMGQAWASGKISLYDTNTPSALLVGLLGGFLFDIATHGTDQDFVQRLTGNRSMQEAKWAIICSTALSITVALIFLGVGSLLWSFYQSHPMPTGTSPDKLFAHFITQYFPAGLRGLMVAGVLAATMSTLDSTINAISACIQNDIMPHRDPSKMKKYLRTDTLITSLLLLIVAYISSTSDGLLMLGLKIVTWTAGSMLALFFTKVLLDKSFQYVMTGPSVLGAYVAGANGVALNTFAFEFSWHWNVYFGCAFAMVFLYFYSSIQNGADTKTSA